MKKLLAVILLLCILMPCAVAEDIDLSIYSFSELAALRDRCQLEMMNRSEWEEVVVPVGVYEIGKDIPAGDYSIILEENTTIGFANIEYFDALDITGHQADKYGSSFYWIGQVRHPDTEPAYACPDKLDIVLEHGYISITFSAVVFTPYSGKVDLEFK